MDISNSIIGILFFYPHFGFLGLGYGVVLGSLLHALVQVPTIIKLKFLPRFSKIQWHDIRDVAIMSLPRTVALSAQQIALIVLVAIASYMHRGSIAVFNFAFNLQSVPLAIIGVSYSVAAFPTLSRLFSKGDRPAFIDHIVTTTRHIIFWSLPIASLFIVLRAQIVRTILGSGAFDWTSTRLTAAALALFAFSVVAQSLVLLFVRGYYAAGQTRTPVIINMASSLLIILLALGSNYLFQTSLFFRFFFESLFRVGDLPGTEVLVLPFAFSLGLIVNVLVLWLSFERDFDNFTSLIRKTIAHSFYVAVLVGFVAYEFLDIFDNFFTLDTLGGIFLQGLLSGIMGIGAGILLLKLLKNRELDDLYHSFRGKFWKIKPILPSPDV